MKYIVGIDESGISNAHKHYLKHISRLEKLQNQQKYFSVVMILMSDDEFSFFSKELKKLKETFFDKQLILHFSDFLNLRTIYKSYSLSKLSEFFFAFLNLIEEVEFKIFQVFVDVKSYYQNFPFVLEDPYFLAIDFFIENLQKSLLLKNLIIFIESRSYFNDQKLYQKLLNKRINLSKKIIFINKNKQKDDYSIIELADFVSYFLFLLKLKNNDKYFAKLPFLKNQNYQLVILIKRILILKYYHFPRFYDKSYKILK